MNYKTKYKKNQFYKELFSLGEPKDKNHICPYCGWRFNFHPKMTKQLCLRCRRFNFKTPKDEFIYRFKEARSKERRNIIGKV